MAVIREIVFDCVRLAVLARFWPQRGRRHDPGRPCREPVLRAGSGL